MALKQPNSAQKVVKVLFYDEYVVNKPYKLEKIRFHLCIGEIFQNFAYDGKKFIEKFQNAPQRHHVIGTNRKTRF